MTSVITTDEQRVNELCDQLLAEHDPKTTKPAAFLGAQFDFGLGWVQFPEGNGGLGLSGMRERALLVGGTLDVRSRRGDGTTITLTME